MQDGKFAVHLKYVIGLNLGEDITSESGNWVLYILQKKKNLLPDMYWQLNCRYHKARAHEPLASGILIFSCSNITGNAELF